jgi:photosystem II stability/assembly factor-like uncharacterized protein
MNMTRKSLVIVLATTVALFLSQAVVGADEGSSVRTEKPVLQMHAAERIGNALHAQILSATHAGGRIVAVGDHGVVLLSDDDGLTFRQARTVPIDGTLTSVSFADDKNGWAAGHWGVIIRTADGGETWSLQRSDLSVDRPLFSVYFSDAKNGWAAGLWSLLLHTEDGGQNWTVVQAPPSPGAKKADRNFYSIFGDKKGTLYVSCEQGLVMRSSDGGVTWEYLQTGYSGSLWTGTALSDGVLLFGGLRGTIIRSADGGSTWETVSTSYKNSITDFVQDEHGNILATSLDGVVLTSKDAGATFVGMQRPDREALTAAVYASGGKLVLFSESGLVK